MEQEFILPKKYCVRQYQCVANYIMSLRTNTSYYHENLHFLCHFPPIRTNYCSDFVIDGYTEITLQQFIKYVLGEDVTIPKENTEYLIKILNKLNIK